ncbi:MAG: IgGFc-binding protein, partial [Bacteroidia bacterium]|nr:IgGFc-binding protein [Bacteroidia bacterium]
MRYKRIDIYIKVLITSLLSLLVFSRLSAQTDTEFWFVAPEVTSNHEDHPVKLRLNAYGEDAIVTITQPANSVFSVPQQFIPAFGTVSVDLTKDTLLIENKPPNMILQKGLLIQSTVPITAYYEVASQRNTDIFTLKGNNALGTYFYIPSQDFYDNNNFSYANPPPYNTFDIVATEDSTQVQITPSHDIVGHLAGVTFTITLNRGETYSAQAVAFLASGHLMGSVVTSDKPIAITFKDDSIWEPPVFCSDLIGDQIIPVKFLGDEYVVVRGFLGPDLNDRVFVVSTADNNDIFLNEDLVTPVATLNAGELYTFTMLETDTVAYIKSDSSVTVLHVSGFSCEVGGAVLPEILSGCNGSSQLAFTRTDPYDFVMFLITNDGAQGSFLIDESYIIDSTQFRPVPGGSSLIYGRFSFPDETLITEGAHIIKNTSGSFHMGILNLSEPMAIQNKGTRYGYFSDFSSLNLGPDRTICPGDSITFDGGGGINPAYQWSNGDTTRTITVKAAGEYWLTKWDNDSLCELHDTAWIFYLPVPNVSIGNDTAICDGDQITLTATGGTFTGFLWNTGDTTSSITVDSTGSYSVAAWTTDQCPGRDTAIVTVNLKDTVSIEITASEDSVCVGEPVTYTATPTHGGTVPVYYWQVNGISAGTNSPVFSYTPVNSDTITCWLKSSEYCVVNDSVLSDSIITTVLPMDTARISIVAENPACESTQVTFSATTENGGPSPTYYWQVNSSNVGTNAPGYSYFPLDGDTVRCWLKSDERCVVSDSVLSNEIVMDILQWETVTVSIVADSNPACVSPTGPVVTFTATPSYGGLGPIYDWYVDGVFQQTSVVDTFAFIPQDNDTVHCILHSNYLCPLDTPATSNMIIMLVLPWDTVSVDISAITPECVGQLVQFTAIPTNGGLNPLYSWFVADTLALQSGSNTFNYNPQSNDIVTCIMKSSYLCPVGDPATSDTIQVLPWLPATVTITATPASMCEGIPITFTADPLNGGQAPAFQWFVNGSLQQASPAILFTYTPGGQDTVWCVMLSNYTCPTDNPDTSNLIITNANPQFNFTPCN